MRIAYVSYGRNMYDYRFLGKMVERGHRPYLISYWPRRVEFRMEGVEFVHYDPAFPKGLGVVLRHLRPFFWARHLRKVLVSVQPDVLHTGYVQSNGFAGALSGFHPTLLMPWGSDILLDPDRSLYNRLVTRFTIRRADMITCDCQLVRDRIVALAGYPQEKIVIFPWGIDLTVFKPLDAPSEIRRQLGWEDKRVLIMTRNFTKPVYGIEYFLDALPAVIQQQPDTRAILVGSGQLEGAYRAQVGRLGLSEYVLFAGRVDERGMAAYLNAADVYVTTSLSDGTSASMLEAMACSLPVVVSDAPAYFEWVEDGINGYIVPRRDSATLTERLVALLKDEDLRWTMGERNLEIAQERADWDKNFDKLEGSYRELALSRPAKES